MSRKTRLILFSIFFILFLIFGPTIVLYSQGYRFDFEAKRITQTGGLFIKAVPKQAEIYINDKLIKKTDFFFGSALIENLLPKKYKIKIEKAGFLPWEKELEVKEKEVTEAKNIVLFPENPGFTFLTKNLEDFWLSPDGKKIILKEREKENWALKLYDLGRQVKSHLLNEEDISKKGAELFDLKFSQNSKEIILEVGLGEQLNPVRDHEDKEKLQTEQFSKGVKYFSLEIDKVPPLLREIKESQLPENVISYQNLNGNIYFLDKFGFVFKSDSSFQTTEKINEIAFSIEAKTEYELRVFPDYIFLQACGNLYLLNPEVRSFEKLFEKIKDLKISPDMKKIVYFSNSEIWILYLKESQNQQRKKVGEKIFLVRFLEKIEDVFWLNSDYLIFSAQNKIKIAEIDDRNRINIVDLMEFREPKIFFNQTDKKIYILSNGNLYQSESLLK